MPRIAVIEGPYGLNPLAGLIARLGDLPLVEVEPYGGRNWDHIVIDEMAPLEDFDWARFRKNDQVLHKKHSPKSSRLLIYMPGFLAPGPKAHCSKSKVRTLDNYRGLRVVHLPSPWWEVCSRGLTPRGPYR